jgi:iron(III) transport system substrate-binding protein
MNRAIVAFLSSVVVLASGLCGPGCSRDPSPAPQRKVVVYTSLDRIFSEPILKEFESRTGIKAEPHYDPESSKTTGLVGELIVRREHPVCDVFWNNEIVQTHRLAKMGLLEAYRSPQAQRIPERFRDAEGRWTGFAARARVLIYNTKEIGSAPPPTGLADLVDARWRGRAAIAKPFFGTTLTHVTALYGAWGPQRLGAWLDAVNANEVGLFPGNGPVRDMVASGEREIGLTDTDDAYEAVLGGKPVKVIVPDANDGALLIPNTVAIINHCPHPEEARRLVDFLLSADVERMLALCPSAQIPLGTDLADVATPWRDLLAGKTMNLDVPAAAASMDDVLDLLRQKGMDR